ncbi:MAG: ABC transporter permease [Bdellovibrionaceae bacterium]|nr:ABC transporter permease [Pseudobdellovibrionaceae bacterium]
MTGIADFFSLHRKFLIYNLVIRNLKVRYRKSVFGFLWTLLVPAAMALVYVFIFKNIARVGGENYALFVVVSIVPWTFFSTALLTGTESLISNFNILSKVPISVSAFPFAETCSAFMNLIFSLPILVIAMAYFGVFPMQQWLILPLIFALLFIQTYALSFILSVSNVYLRDVRHLVSILVQIWMYMTPVLYTKDLIPPEYLKWFYLNPLFFVFDSLHGAAIQGQWPTQLALVHMISWSFLLIGIAYVVNLKLKYRVVEKI